ncbi:hypothetical protein VFPPC_16219 [Pochonia chlamydosporia 170]|uniref:Secreted protein n=1 Tax=Pochonia chlamydosporia 170 TaxID=1380566 RepID=A0A179FGK7_METCM|nr:hypothetical protein VFPPC_16219 [Pochonia chlamydosporia 170]OAQ64478.2 hypothetical protein VFPPC_16219 [Pochonia chlamydosporia 170]
MPPRSLAMSPSMMPVISIPMAIISLSLSVPLSLPPPVRRLSFLLLRFIHGHLYTLPHDFLPHTIRVLLPQKPIYKRRSK